MAIQYICAALTAIASFYFAAREDNSLIAVAGLLAAARIATA